MTGTTHPKLLAATVLAAAVVALCLISALPRNAEAAFPGQNGRVFFDTARDDGRTNIYSINADGTDPASLPRSSEAIADHNPAVFANGEKVAYEHDRDIWVMNADGSDPKPVTTDGGTTEELDPSWSPDGTRIAFYGITSNSREIYTVKVDGSERKPLTSESTQDEQPAWSPDGTKIAYVVCCHNIWVMDADDGANKTNLTGSSTYPGVAGGSKEPNWSPDGSKIVFTGGPDCNFSCTGTDIYVMNSGGGGEVNLTPTDENHFQPVFSPDGNKIAFTSNTINGAQYDIFTMNANGTALSPLTNDAAQDANPDWSVPPRDGDGDGVPDYRDACPTQAANTPNGCPNQPPVAGIDSYKAKEGKTLNVGRPGVLGNDEDPESDPLRASLVSGPSNGKLTLEPDGSFTYKPRRTFSGRDSFVYEVSDGEGGTDRATVTITVKKARK